MNEELFESIVYEIKESFEASRESCIEIFEEYIDKRAYHVEHYADPDEEVLCLLEDQAFLVFSPCIMGICHDTTSLDSADLSEQSEKFFKQQKYLPDWFYREYHEKTEQLSETQSKEFHSKASALVCKFFSEAWGQANRNKKTELELYICEHLSNDEIRNIENGEVRRV